jgi:hypothetical protein
MTAGNFSVAEIEGNLEVTLAANNAAGTVDKNTSGFNDLADNVIKVPDTNVLYHGSVDHNTGNAWILDPESAKNAETFLDRDLASDTNSKWKYKTGVTLYDNSAEPQAHTGINVFVAVAWTMKFRYTFASETSSVGVYLDPKASAIAETTGSFTQPVASGKKGDTAKGFRIGFYGGTGVHNVVWSNNKINDAAETDSTLQWDGKYVIAASDNTSTTTTDERYGTYKVHSADTLAGQGDIFYDIPSDGTYTRIEDTDTRDKATYAAERICTLTKGSSEEVTVTCAAWFEGCDPNVVSGAAMKCMSASMVFYARTDAAS